MFHSEFESEYGVTEMFKGKYMLNVFLKLQDFPNSKIYAMLENIHNIAYSKKIKERV